MRHHSRTANVRLDPIMLKPVYAATVAGPSSSRPRTASLSRLLGLGRSRSSPLS